MSKENDRNIEGRTISSNQEVTNAVNSFVTGESRKNQDETETSTEKWTIDDLPTSISTSEITSSWAKDFFDFMKSQCLIPGFEREEVSLDELLKRENKVIDLIRKDKR